MWSYVGDVRFNSLSGSLQQSFGQVVRLFIQILEGQKNKSEDQTAGQRSRSDRWQKLHRMC